MKKFLQNTLIALFPSLHKRISFWRDARLRQNKYAEWLDIFGLIVLSGPFKGMHYIPKAFCGPLLPKIIGCYEMELHKAFEQMIERRFHKIIDIGCAEGYYAVGLAIRLPDSVIVAFDSDTKATNACAEMSRLNNVEKRVVLKGECDIEALSYEISNNALIVCDCEGYEDIVLDPERIPDLKSCHLIVELHDDIVPGVCDRITRRFRDTHNIEIIKQRKRKVSEHPEVLILAKAEDRPQVINEERPNCNFWAVLIPK
jgi:hypothetical protein